MLKSITAMFPPQVLRRCFLTLALKSSKFCHKIFINFTVEGSRGEDKWISRGVHAVWSQRRSSQAMKLGLLIHGPFVSPGNSATIPEVSAICSLGVVVKVAIPHV